jgi:rod shape-determining protein MreC
MAQVIGRDPRGWFSHWTLDVGKNQNVKVGQVVVAEGGLVGKVISVEDNSCAVKPFVDSDVVVGRMPERKGSVGVIQGKGTPNLVMERVDPNTGVKVGDRVETSGHDGQFPPGIPIGVVSQLVHQFDSSSVNAIVTPSACLDDVREVIILRGNNET